MNTTAQPSKDGFTREQLYSVPDIKNRGWTDTAIKKFLPAQPDDTRPNPYYSRAGAPMKFWLVRRVHRAEKTKKFTTWRAGAGERSDQAERAVTTRVDNIVKKMGTAEITIQRGLTKEQIHKLAIITHGGNYLGDPGEFVWSNRKARDCIRHNLTNYEQLWNICNRGKTGKAAYELLRSRVDALIDETYPEYASDDSRF